MMCIECLNGYSCNTFCFIHITFMNVFQRFIEFWINVSVAGISLCGTMLIIIEKIQKIYKYFKVWCISYIMVIFEAKMQFKAKFYHRYGFTINNKWVSPFCSLFKWKCFDKWRINIIEFYRLIIFYVIKLIYFISIFILLNYKLPYVK